MISAALKGLSLLMISMALALPARASDYVTINFPTLATNGVKEQSIQAYVYKPEGAGPFPVVIELNGCGGLDANDEAWARHLVSWGYVAVTLDDFASWGYGNICSDTTVVSPKMRIHDVIGAIKYLRGQPYIDAKRVSLLGFSHGGWTIMSAIQSYAYLKDFGVKSAVAFYPFCDKTGLDKAVIPTLILMGDKDDWTPADQCRQVIASNPPGIIEGVFYPNTYHGFDTPNYRPIFIQGRANNQVVNRRVEANPSAAADAIERARQFFARTLN